MKYLDKYFEKNSRKSIMLTYGEIKKLFSPECEKQGLKPNQILNVYALNINLEIHLSYILSLGVLETRLHYWERNKTTTKKTHINFPCPLGSNLSFDFFRKQFVF